MTKTCGNCYNCIKTMVGHDCEIDGTKTEAHHSACALWKEIE